MCLKHLETCNFFIHVARPNSCAKRFARLGWWLRDEITQHSSMKNRDLIPNTHISAKWFDGQPVIPDLKGRDRTGISQNKLANKISSIDKLWSHWETLPQSIKGKNNQGLFLISTTILYMHANAHRHISVLTNVCVHTHTHMKIGKVYKMKRIRTPVLYKVF